MDHLPGDTLDRICSFNIIVNDERSIAPLKEIHLSYLIESTYVEINFYTTSRFYLYYLLFIRCYVYMYMCKLYSHVSYILF